MAPKDIVEETLKYCLHNRRDNAVARIEPELFLDAVNSGICEEFYKNCGRSFNTAVLYDS